MFRRALLATLLTLSAACATTGATLGSGVGDRMLSRAPFYAGARLSPVSAAGTQVGVMPIRFQVRQGMNSIFDPRTDPNSPMSVLLADMNAYLDSVMTANGSTPIRLGSFDAPPMLGVAPDVRFGCLTEGDLPGEDCIARGDSVLGRVDALQQMKLSVGRPSAAWVASAADLMSRAEVSHTLIITLEIGEYWMRQTGALGRKSVELGTNHTASQPWMTSLETPIPVLQLTGALVDAKGRAVRVGAEGILAKRTPLLASGVGLQAQISEADVLGVSRARRPELPGQPLAWQEALRQLVHGLTR